MQFSMYCLLAANDVLKSIGGIILAIVILLAMVTIHEFGHYVAGKLLGFKINEFSVGFGPALFKKRSKKTGELFALRVIPLGGYCAFDGEDEFVEETPKKEQNDGGMSASSEEPAQTSVFEELPETAQEKNEKEKEKDEEYPEPKGERFNDQAPWKRIIVLVAGATMNYLLALFLIVIMFAFIGRPFFQVQVEYPEDWKGEILQPLPQPNGLKTGDVILTLDGKDVYLVTDYFDVLSGKKKGEEVPVLVLREGKEVACTIVLSCDAEYKNLSDTNTLYDSMGIFSLYSTNYKQGFFPTIGHSFMYSFKVGGSVLRSLGELLTGKLGLDAMGGPVTTITVTSKVAISGFAAFLNIAAFIGVNLAVFNLLPVPALDGCKVIFCAIEWIRKKPINRKVEAIINVVGLFVLFGFAILVDVLQFF